MKIEDLTWSLKPARPYVPRDVGSIRRIVFHHTATPTTTRPEQIHEEHIRRGWSGIGYNYVIRESGTVYKTRPVSVVPACVEKGNTPSICIAWIGDYEKRELPTAAVIAARELVRMIRDAYPWIVEVYGHCELNATSCPGRYGMEVVGAIRK